MKVVLLLLLIVASVNALDNGLGLTPVRKIQLVKLSVSSEIYFLSFKTLVADGMDDLGALQMHNKLQ